jgi:hypothetical protein
MKFILEKLGQDPQRSLSIFLRGLGLFAIGVIFIFVGYYHHHYWQMLGMGFLAIAVLISAYGYIGIFANRLLNITEKRSHKKYR